MGRTWIYVDSMNGDDGRPGTVEDSPVRTLQTALNRARSEHAAGVRMIGHSSFVGETIRGAASGDHRHPFAWMGWRGRPTIRSVDGVPCIDIGARGLHDVLFDGFDVLIDEPATDAVRIIGVNADHERGVSGVALRDINIFGGYRVRNGLNMQAIDGLKLLNVNVLNIYRGHRSQGAFIGGCKDLSMTGCEFWRCGWNPSEPETADAQNQGVYCRTIAGYPIEGISVFGCVFGDSSSWALTASTDFAALPVRGVAVNRCAFIRGGKGIVLGAAEPGSHIEPRIGDCHFDGVGHGHDGSPGILALIEGATDAEVRNTSYSHPTHGLTHILHSGELGNKPPSTGTFEDPVRVEGEVDLSKTAGGIIRQVQSMIGVEAA